MYKITVIMLVIIGFGILIVGITFFFTGYLDDTHGIYNYSPLITYSGLILIFLSITPIVSLCILRKHLSNIIYWLTMLLNIIIVFGIPIL